MDALKHTFTRTILEKVGEGHPSEVYKARLGKYRTCSTCSNIHYRERRREEKERERPRRDRDRDRDRKRKSKKERKRKKESGSYVEYSMCTV